MAKGFWEDEEFPEVDRAEWMNVVRASEMLVKGQVPIIERLRVSLIDAGFKADDIVKAPEEQDSDMLF